MSKKILIVEDNEMNMKLFCDLVSLCGFESIPLRSGVNSLEVALEEKPHLILMDIQLPEVSGIELIKQFKDHDILKHIPIIAITAFAMKGDEEKIVEAGCEVYVSKPICVNELKENIQRLVG